MRGVVLAAALLAVGAGADADPVAHGVRAVVERPPEQFTPLIVAPKSDESPFLYLNRCVGGCLVTGTPSTNDARDLESTIPTPGQYLVGEFANDSGQTGSAADDQWNALVLCVQQVYAPYALTVTDQVPNGETYTESLVGGLPSDIGRPPDNLGVATVTSNCSPVDNALSFVFANTHPGSGMDRVYDICWTAAQESAHEFGLDHEYQFTDGQSACNDPMTYRTDCGGEKFFRDMQADCGETAVRPCKCSATQNSSAILMSVFGPGTPITAPPHVAITLPVANSSVTDTVDATAGSVPGLDKLELFINGSRYSDAFASTPFGPEGQPDAEYSLTVPTSVPKGTLQLVVRATDDLGLFTDSAAIDVTNGPPCTTNGNCLTDQTCSTDQLCEYPPPTLELGDTCSYDQQCTTWECGHFSDGSMCTTECEVDESTSCPAAFSCVDAGNGHGLCVSGDGGGCCQTGRGGSPWSDAAIAAAILALVLRRRRAR